MKYPVFFIDSVPENEVKAVKVAVLAPHGVSTTPHVSCTMQLIGHTLLCVGRTRQSWELQEGLRDPRGVGGLLYMKQFYGLELLKNHFQTKKKSDD